VIALSSVEELVLARSPRAWAFANAVRLAVERRVRHDGAVCRGSSRAPLVALTFDDGPDPRTTPAVLDVLDRARARATFFVLGAAVEREPALSRRLAAMHEVGTHLYSHRRGASSTRAGFDDEVRRAFAVHRRVLGEVPALLRFPFADRGAVRRRDVERWGLSAVHWTFSSEDSSASCADAIVSHVVPRLHPGAIVLFHDGRGPFSRKGALDRSATALALPRILDAIAARGLRTATVGGMLSDRASTAREPSELASPATTARISNGTSGG